MWAIITAGIAFTAALVLSLAKASSRGDNIAKSHREELFARKKEETGNSKEDD